MSSKIINNVATEIKEKFQPEPSGHDWWHIYRVWQMAKKLTKFEKVDKFVVEIAALLHDIADWKFYGGDEKAGSNAAKKLLNKYKIEPEKINHICEIIDHVSFKGAKVKNNMQSLEGKIVQDSDRLDAMGAIGIARTFHYGGYTSRQIYNPEIKSVLHRTKDAYLKNNAPTINHFYEKLLLLKDMMHTRQAKKIALKRHNYMLKYINRLQKECNLKWR